MSKTNNIIDKSSWREEYLNWIYGFTNANCGTIFICKDNAGNVVGTSNSKKLMEVIPNKVKDRAFKIDL